MEKTLRLWAPFFVFLSVFYVPSAWRLSWKCKKVKVRTENAAPERLVSSLAFICDFVTSHYISELHVSLI